jgi:hypothetical protein
VASWWVSDTEGDVDTDGVVVRFRFGGAPAPGGFDIKVLETTPGELVLWKVVQGPDEWVGTHIRFDLKVEDDFTIVLFGHLDWKEPKEFMSHCSMKWATFLMSLKQLVETGTGAPSPRDVQISNWN